mgnify:CR=1 FL=1
MAIDLPTHWAADAEFRKLAEWEPHKAVWVAWPWDDTDWQDELPKAQQELAQLCQGIINLDDSNDAQGEAVHMLVRNPDDEHAARLALGMSAKHVRFYHLPTGDLWLRDTAPVFMRNDAGNDAAVCFKFNGWGGKYLYPDDVLVAKRIAAASEVTRFDVPLILEGGGLEFDGEGTCLTTRQCLLHPKRNPTLDEAHIEDILKRSLGMQKVLWLDKGLLNDHTDGHIDNLARFVAPGAVVCTSPHPKEEPNSAVLSDIHNQLSLFKDARGRSLKVMTLPSPGLVAREDGSPYPASYLNFYIANSTVIVPAFGKETDTVAKDILAPLFPTRRVISLPALSLLTGGGTFHCITQQQ